MSRVHVCPVEEVKLHNLDSADCFCEPKILDEGLDNEGGRALIFVHQQTRKVDSEWQVSEEDP